LKSVIIEEYVSDLPIDHIDVDPHNVRTIKQKSGLKELMISIEKYGLIQPVIVIRKGERFKLIVGQRRKLAFEELKRKTIPALIIKSLDSNVKTIVSYGENLLRKSLPYEDTIKVVNELFESYKGTKAKRIKQIHEDLGISANTVAEYLAHKLVPPEVRKLVSEGKLTMDLAYRITAANYPDIKTIIQIANETARLTKDEKERVKEYEAKNPNSTAEEVIEYAKNPPPQAELVIYIELELKQRLEKLSHRKKTDITTVVKDAITRYLVEEE